MEEPIIPPPSSGWGNFFCKMAAAKKGSPLIGKFFFDWRGKAFTCLRMTRYGLRFPHLGICLPVMGTSVTDEDAPHPLQQVGEDDAASYHRVAISS